MTFQNIANVQVTVNTEAPAWTAEEVERLITYPIETAMSSVPGVEEVYSVTRTGFSGVVVVFSQGADIDSARQWVVERLQAAEGLLPSGVGTPAVGALDRQPSESL